MQPILNAVFTLIALGIAYLCLERHRLRLDGESAVVGAALWLTGLLALAQVVVQPDHPGTSGVHPGVSFHLLGLTYLLGFTGIALSTHLGGRGLRLGDRGRYLSALGLLGVAVLIAFTLPRITAVLPRAVNWTTGGLIAAAAVWAIAGSVRRVRAGKPDSMARALMLASLIWTAGALGLLTAPLGDSLSAYLAGVARAIGAGVLMLGLLREQVRLSRDADARLRDLERLHGAGKALVTTLDPTEVVETTAAKALEVSGAAAAVLFRLDVDARVVHAVSWAGHISAELARSLELPVGQGAAGMSIAHGRTVWTANLQEDLSLGFPPDVTDRMAREGFKAVVALPVTFRSGTTFGALSLVYRDTRVFAETDLDLLRGFGAQAAMALENARAFEQLASRAARDAGLHELTLRLLEATAEEVIRSASVRFTMTLLGADFVALFIADPKAGELRVKAGLGWSPGVVGELSVAPSDESFAGYAFVHKTALVVEDLGDERRFSIPAYLKNHGVRSGLVVPLGVRREPVGALAAYYRAPRRFTEEESRVLTTVAEETALALERARVYADQRENMERLQDTQAQVMQADKLQALGTLLSGLAHELNNPLSTIQLSVQLMKRQQSLPDNVRRRMDAMEDECDRASRIIRDLLVFARRKPPERRPVDINDVIRGTLAAQAADFDDQSAIRVVTELTQTPEIMADPHQLQQVLMNLFTNARHAMQAVRGHGTLTVRSAMRGGQVVVEVEDDGPGIAPDNLGRIFDPFFTTKSAGEGSGLGLSLSIGIVQAHGGTIQVANVPTTGARFIVGLPVGDREPDGAAPVADAQAGRADSRRRARVLVVDDEVQLRATLTEVFEALGHDVESVGSGAEALTRLANGGFDFVSLDMRLPDIDGKGIWQELVTRNPALAARVVFMTGDTMSPDALQFLQETGRPVLTKPLSIDRVGRIVEEVLAASAPPALA